MTLFKGSHHFSSTLAVFDDTLYRQPSRKQNFSSLWWRSLKTLFEDRHHFSRTLAGFDDTLSRQPSLQQSLMTVLFSKEPFAAAFEKNKKLFIILLTQRESISFILGYHCSIGPLTRPDESKEFKDRQWLGRRIDWGHSKGRRSHQTINSIYHLWIQVCIIAIYCRMAVCRISSMWFTALCWFGIFYILHRM